MGQLIPFESAQLPAHLRGPAAAAINEDLTNHAGGGFPVLSIKGKSFAVVRDGERTTLMNPKDPDSPANYVELVIIKANKNTSKVWYASGYVEGAEAKKPDCFSNDGIRPDDSSEQKQHPVCATCRHNQWGARITPDGKKGKTCADSVRMAVAPADALNDPMLLRVPPATIRVLGEYGTFLGKKGVSYPAVVTRIGFDADQATPKLNFKPMGFLDEKQFKAVLEARESDVVQSILGTSIMYAPVDPETGEVFEQAASTTVQSATVAKSKEVSDAEIAAALQAEEDAREEAELERRLAEKRAKKAAADKTKAIAKAAAEAPLPVDDDAEPANMTDSGLDLSGLSFDD